MKHSNVKFTARSNRAKRASCNLLDNRKGDKMKEYITVKQFAEMTGKTPQAVYKALNNPKHKLNNFVSTVDNQKKIEISALKEVYGIEVDNQSLKVEQPVEQPNSTASDESNTAVLIQILTEQLAEKDKQLSEANQQIKELHRLIDQQQQLHLSSMKLLQEGQPTDEAEQEEDTTTNDLTTDTQPKPQKKKGLFSFLSRN